MNDEIENLREFARQVMSHWPYDGVDGEELQEAAVSCGLLTETLVDGPCREGCLCAEYGEFPTMCYKRVYWL